MFAKNLCLTYPVPLLAMKQTPDDLRFAGDFAEALLPHIADEKKKGHSMRQIAEKLGVTEPALKKYLGGRTTPCLRTVVLAYGKYGLAVPYSGVSFVGAASRNRKRGRNVRPLQQLFLPFEIQAPGPSDRLVLKLLPTGERRYQLQVRLQVAR
jgi:transcriptional regulator with XRE-family HTH domain